MSVRVLIPTAALLALAIAACAGAAPPPSTPGALGPPPVLAPLPPELAKSLPDLKRSAEEYRGLRFRREVPSGLLSGPALRREVDRQMAEDMPPGALASLGAALKAFGLVPETMDLAAYYPQLLASQIAAFYDPDRKYLAVVDLGRGEDEEVEKELGPAFAARAREGVLVHELTHALQDQAFDMTRYERTDPLSDADAARLALVEGDATETMMDFLLGKKIEDLPGAAELMGAMPDDVTAAAPGFPGSREMAAAPAWFRDSLLFSYLRGFRFAVAVRQRGGQKLLDYAFAQDPPRSSEQVLHPEKWYGRRDDPVVLALPDLAPLLPGARKVAEGELGEEGIRILLTGPLGGAEAAGAAAAGWGGDRFAVYERDGRRLLAWATEWDTEADATEFLAAAGHLGGKPGAGWTVRRTSPTRVVLVRGDLSRPGEKPEALREAVLAGLAAARAERPANRPIDLAALGVPAASEAPKPDAKPAPETAPPPADGARPLPHLAGRRYTDPARGFAVELPEAGGPWAIDAGAAPGVPLRFQSADGDLVLEVGDRGPAAAGRPFGELGESAARRFAAQGGRVLSARLAAPAGPYEIEAEAPRGGRLFRQRIRLYRRGGRLVEVRAFAPAAAWPARAGEAAAFLDSFALDPPPAAPLETTPPEARRPEP